MEQRSCAAHHPPASLLLQDRTGPILEHILSGVVCDEQREDEHLCRRRQRILLHIPLARAGIVGYRIRGIDLHTIARNTPEHSAMECAGRLGHWAAQSGEVCDDEKDSQKRMQSGLRWRRLGGGGAHLGARCRPTSVLSQLQIGQLVRQPRRMLHHNVLLTQLVNTAPPRVW